MTTTRQNLEAEALVLAELEARRRSFPLYYFKPHDKGREFLTSAADISIFEGGNRSGKTEHGVAKICGYALGYFPWVLREADIPEPEKWWQRPAVLPDEALARNTEGVRVPVPNTVLVVTGLTARKGITETLWPKLKTYLGGAIAKVRMGNEGAPVEVTLKNDSRIVFGSSKQDVLAFEGSNYTAIAFDEPPARDIWSGIYRGAVDQMAPIWLTFTPIGPNAAWLFYELVSIADGKKIGVTRCSIFDNPYLSDEQKRRFAENPTWTETERRARLYGDFAVLSDRIYTIYDDKVHRVPGFEPPLDWPIGLVVDPHQVRPWAMAWFALSPRGAIYFFREWPAEPYHKMRADPRSMEEYATLIRQIEGRRPAAYRLIDPNAGPRRDTFKGLYIPSFVDELAQFGLHFHHKLADGIEFGEGQVKRLLAFDPQQPLGALNMPKLFFTEDCHNVLNSMRFYSAKQKPGTLDEPHEEKRDETFKDFADLVRYVAVSGLSQAALSDTIDPFESVSDGPTSYAD